MLKQKNSIDGLYTYKTYLKIFISLLYFNIEPQTTTEKFFFYLQFVLGNQFHN